MGAMMTNVYQTPFIKSISSGSISLKCQATAGCNATLDCPNTSLFDITIQDCQFGFCSPTPFLNPQPGVTEITFNCSASGPFTALVTNAVAQPANPSCSNPFLVTVDITPALTEDPCIGTIINWDPDGAGGTPPIPCFGGDAIVAVDNAS